MDKKQSKELIQNYWESAYVDLSYGEYLIQLKKTGQIKMSNQELLDEIEAFDYDSYGDSGGMTEIDTSICVELYKKIEKSRLEIRCDTKEQVGLCLNKLFKDGANWAMDGTTWSWKDGYYIVLHVECDLIRYSQNKVEPTKMDALQYLNR